MVEPRRTPHSDPLLLLEAVLGLVLLALFVGLFWIPAADGPLFPRWWTGLLLSAVFFAILGLESWRRRRRGRSALRESLEEAQERKRPGGGPLPPPA